MKSFAIVIAKLMAILAAIFILFLGYNWWDMRRLQLFCDEVKVGTPMSEVMKIAVDYGVETHWFNEAGILDEITNERISYFPATSTMGDVACEIRHDTVTVLSAQVK